MEVGIVRLDHELLAALVPGKPGREGHDAAARVVLHVGRLVCASGRAAIVHVRGFEASVKGYVAALCRVVGGWVVDLWRVAAHQHVGGRVCWRVDSDRLDCGRSPSHCCAAASDWVNCHRDSL